MSQKPVVSGVNTEIRRNIAATSVLKSKYVDVENKKKSFYHLFWKRKFSWIIVLGGIGFLIFETLHPDKANRTEKLKSDWAHLAGGAYDPTKPQKENRVTKEWLADFFFVKFFFKFSFFLRFYLIGLFS